MERTNKIDSSKFYPNCQARSYIIKVRKRSAWYTWASLSQKKSLLPGNEKYSIWKKRQKHWQSGLLAIKKQSKDLCTDIITIAMGCCGEGNIYKTNCFKLKIYLKIFKIFKWYQVVSIFLQKILYWSFFAATSKSTEVVSHSQV